jgi:esterase/lipase superfamily enzyme
MHREHLAWDSPRLSRRMELLWFGHAGRPLLIFPTAASRFYEAEDFLLVNALRPKIEAGELQVCCVDTVNLESWHNKQLPPLMRVARHEQYDAYLRDELVPMIQNRSQRKDLITYGSSFGAYHAMNFGCRYPHLVKKIICFSGIYDIHRMLDGQWSDACYFHCPTAYIPNMDDYWVSRLKEVEIVIATGEHDTLVENNRGFLGILAAKGIAAHGEIWPGVFGHDWPYWREHLPRFVP